VDLSDEESEESVGESDTGRDQSDKDRALEGQERPTKRVRRREGDFLVC